MIKESEIPSPSFILNEAALIENLEKITYISHAAGVEFILALKGFAMWSAFPVINQYIKSATASSLHELQLCNEFMEQKSHTYAVAFKANDMKQILAGSSHISFNSINQYNQFSNQAKAANVSIGIRINPEYSDVETALYNPASPESRLGITANQLGNQLPDNIDGLHYHVHCESDSFALEKSLQSLEENFGQFLPKIKWVNVGGGHLVTRQGYNIQHLIEVLKAFKTKHDVDIILEPGSAFAWQTGSLKTTVLDIIDHGAVKTAIIDASFTCHMPDCLEMPYRPAIRQGYADVSQGKFKYRLGGMSCLAGDFLEAYSFDRTLKIGDQLDFEDMMHYTMVKTNTFNGVQHPSIVIQKVNGTKSIIREFSYLDYRNRLS